MAAKLRLLQSSFGFYTDFWREFKRNKLAITFQDNEVRSNLKNKRQLSAFLKTIFKNYGRDYKQIHLAFIFCNDDYLLAINRQFLNHDTLTDIITFDLSPSPTALEAEIYISTDRVTDNAAKFETSFIQELHRVIFHGTLHLCGLKDKSPADKKKMRIAENDCLIAYFQTTL